MHTVYILKSLKFPERVYVGITEDVKRRLEKHNNGDSTYTKRYAPWDLKTTISFRDKKRAEAFERYLKSGSGFAFLKRRLV